jgi:hypothetical protein
MKQAGLVILVGLILVVAFGGQEFNEDTVILAIVAIVLVFGLTCALLGFMVYSGVRETQAWAARPAPPTVVYPPMPALPQAQQQPMVIVLQQPQAQDRGRPQVIVIPQQVAGPQGARALPGGFVDGESRELTDLFYPRREG